MGEMMIGRLSEESLMAKWSPDEAEGHCKRALTQLQEEYQIRAKPYIDMLVRLQSMKPVVFMVDSSDNVDLSLIPSTIKPNGVKR